MDNIIGERVYLRKLTSDDASERYANWLNDPTVNKYLETRSATVKSVREYIEEKSADHNVLFMGIFDKATDLHIGNVKLEPIDLKKKMTVFGIMIGDKNFWGKGLGTEATRLISDYALHELKLDEVELGVIIDNVGACKAYERAGFKQVKLKPKSANHDGVMYDVAIMIKRR